MLNKTKKHSKKHNPSLGFPTLMCFVINKLDLLNDISRLFDCVSTLQTLHCCFWFKSSLAVLHFLSEKWNSFGMSFFEKKIEKIHRGSPPTLCSSHTHTLGCGRTHSHIHYDILPHAVENQPLCTHTHFSLTDTHWFTLAYIHTNTRRAAAVLAGKHQTPREEGGQAFPTFRLHGYFRRQAKNSVC